MKGAALLAGLILGFATVASSSPEPDAERLALGRQVAAELAPLMTQGRTHLAIDEVVMAWEQARMAETMPSLPPPAPDIPITRVDVPQLYASLKVGADAIGPRAADAAGEFFAAAHDARTLKAVADFYGAPKERAIQERRRRAMEEGAARSVELAQIFMHGKASGEQAAQEMARVVEDMRHIVGPSPEEAAFEKSAAARAFESGPPAPPSTSLWPEMIAAAEADYCRNRACDDATRKFFAALSAADPAKIYDPGKTDPLAAPTAGAPPSAPPSPH
jgi:hypothetical protein